MQNIDSPEKQFLLTQSEATIRIPQSAFRIRQSAFGNPQSAFRNRKA
jgi:hypothetical protein